MDYRLKIFYGLICSALLGFLSLQNPAFAKSATTSAGHADKQRYIVVLDDLPLAIYDGRSLNTPERDKASMRLQATTNHVTGKRKLDPHSPASKKYLQFLDERFEFFRGEALLKMGRKLKPVHRYRNALNGFSAELTAVEAQALREMPRVSSVRLDEIQRMETDSGPNWLGADKIYDGSAGFAPTGGEGVVIGVIDSGVNWDHPSFKDPGEDGAPGWDHVNPYGQQLGLCSQSEVMCNDKLVGVYDFVEDDPNTGDTEEHNNGKDNTGHGTHVISIAAGNALTVELDGGTNVGGVAPNANIISYRVCYVGNPVDVSDDGCQTSAIISAVDQAIEDGVDVINYSIGSEAHDPWDGNSTTLAFLSARAAGIFVATSVGNAGPNAGSVGSPANAPWITAVGNATHDRSFATVLEDLSGGDSIPPSNLIGASITGGLGVREIVHAKDFGNAFCGTGEPESKPNCVGNTGLSNPFPPGTFNGQIVICDRGTYGRVEKGKNLMLAGAGGYVLANTGEWGEATVADFHCLPTTHLGFNDSEKLRNWQDGGTNHQGSISNYFTYNIASAGDIINPSSSRGPNLPPVENILKPDVIAPGTQILGANNVENNFIFLTGTSMASPHVTGGAALLKAVHPSWTPSMIASALVMTATPELAEDFDGSQATALKRGGGRPRLDEAANSGVYLDETQIRFINADPQRGGDPKALNLPGLTDTVCRRSCEFKRTVTDLAGGGAWSASVKGLPSGATVNITPGNFSLTNGASRQLTISVDLSQYKDVGEWVYGEVRLTSNSFADAVFPLAIFADGGELPAEWEIRSNRVSGSQEFAIDGLAAMPDATFTSGGLVVPTLTIRNLPQDPNNESPYNGPVGVTTVWHTVPAGTLWLHTQTLESTAADIDLFVGLDANGNGIAEEFEELCSSTSPEELELCDIFTPEAGEYWVLIQNWTATLDPDEVTLRSAVVGKNTSSSLTATGEGIVSFSESQNIRLSWNDVGAVPGTQLMGAVGLGTRREKPNNIGIIPVKFVKTGITAPETLVLMNGVNRGLTVPGLDIHDRIFVDIPPGTDSFTISTSATGTGGNQNQAISMELYRMGFDGAFSAAPFAAAPNTSGTPLASASGTSSNGPAITVSGSNVIPGRWYAVLKNTSGAHADVQIKADLVFAGTPVPLRAGLWQASSRENLNQGFDYTSTGGYRAFLWYTFDEDGSPAWYLASAPEPAGNVWVAELLRFTNDGTLQHSVPVGHVSVTLLAEQDSIFSFVLFGEDGSDRERPSLSPTCPTIDNEQRSYTGLWSRAADGVGGATVAVPAGAQAFLHYIYDDNGNPVWLLGVPEPQSATAVESPLSQYGGFCAVCAEKVITVDPVGLFTRTFTNEDSMTWNLDYVLKSPLGGTINRSDDTSKLTAPAVCQ